VNLAKQMILGAIPLTLYYELSHLCRSMNLVLAALPLKACLATLYKRINLLL